MSTLSIPTLVQRLQAEPGLVDVNRAASYFSVDPETVRRWVRAGTISHSRIAGQLRFDPADLLAFYTARYSR